MDYYLLWSLLLGALGGGLAASYLGYRLRMLELELATFAEKFLSDQKRRAVRARWDQDAQLADLASVAQPVQIPKKNHLLKFGIGGKA